jgi:hypothetical protein
VYLLPAFLSSIHYTRLNDGVNRYNLIPIANSYREWTIYVTTNRDLFDPTSPAYNPLAVPLGTIYLSPKITVDDLAILDARRRGGGFAHDLTLSECQAVYNEADACWDIGYLIGDTYPKNANFIIRIPGWVEQFFTPTEVTSIVEKIVPAGTLWKIEYVYGSNEDG